jgi:hypothetical protein
VQTLLLRRFVFVGLSEALAAVGYTTVGEHSTEAPDFVILGEGEQQYNFANLTKAVAFLRRGWLLVFRFSYMHSFVDAHPRPLPCTSNTQGARLLGTNGDLADRVRARTHARRGIVSFRSVRTRVMYIAAQVHSAEDMRCVFFFFFFFFFRSEATSCLRADR